MSTWDRERLQRERDAFARWWESMPFGHPDDALTAEERKQRMGRWSTAWEAWKASAMAREGHGQE